MEERMSKGESVSLTNCTVKKSRIGEGYDVLMSDKSSVVSSPKRFKIDEELREKMMNPSNDLEKLDCVNDIATNTGMHVGIRGKVVSVKEIEEIKSSRGVRYRKQECVISQGRKGHRLVVWEDLVNKVESGVSYNMKNVLVKSYQGVKYFSTASETEFTVIDDLGDVRGELDDGNVTFIGEVVGVESFTEFIGCVTCNAKVSELNDIVGQCSKCGMKQKLSRCKKSRAASVVLEDGDKRKCSVLMFSKIIDLLIDDVGENYDDVETKLLCADCKEFRINSRKVVIGFSNAPQVN